MATESETRLDDILKKVGSLIAIIAISAFLYACFVIMRDTQPTFITSQDVLTADTRGSRVLDGEYSAKSQTYTLNLTVSDDVTQISLLLFRSGKAAQSVSIWENGDLVGADVFSQESSLITYTSVTLKPSAEEESVGTRTLSVTLKGVNSSGPGVLYLGPQNAMTTLINLSAYISLFEIGLLIAMVFYGLTLYRYKRSEDYMLRYVLYVTVLLCQAILFSSAWNTPLIELGFLGRPFAVFTRVVAYMLSFYIAFRLMDIKLGRVGRVLLSGRMTVILGSLCAALVWVFGSSVESTMTLIYNTLALATSVYICIVAKPKDTIIAAVLLASVLISSNASFFGFLHLNYSMAFCVLFTTAPLFSLPFALVVMFCVNRLFAKKFQEQEELATELDDLVNQRTRELRVKEAQRRQMMLNIFHDLRTPLFVSKGCTEAILANPEAAVEKATTMKSRIDFMTTLTNDLFNLAKLEEGRVLFAEDPVNLKTALESVAGSWDAYKSTYDVTVELQAPEDIIVVGDQMRLLEAVQNLVDNAVKHSPDGGTVLVDVALVGDRATISVIDQGPGLTAEECAVIFEYYYTKNRSKNSEGTGIGLPIAKEIVEHMDGTLTVQSQVGQGTTFTISLPAELDLDDEDEK